MMTTAEIAALLLHLLGWTRIYRGVTFDCLHLEPAEQIKFAEGLLKAMPKPERRIVETAFEHTRAAITAERMARALATHPTPEAVQ